MWRLWLVVDALLLSLLLAGGAAAQEPADGDRQRLLAVLAAGQRACAQPEPEEVLRQAIDLLREAHAGFEHLADPAHQGEALAAIASCQRALGDRSGEAETLSRLGYLQYQSGDNAGAIGSYERAFALRQEEDEPAPAAKTLMGMAMVFRATGDPRKAVELYVRSLEIFRATRSRAEEAHCLNGLGRAYLDLGEPDQALAALEQGLAVAEALSDRALESDFRTALGLLRLEAGEAGRSLDEIERALVLYRQTGDRFGESQARILLARAHAYLGETDKALAGLEEALRMARELEDRFGESVALSDMGRAQARQGRLADAARSFQGSLDLARAVGDRFGEAQCLVRLGEIQRALGASQDALVSLEQALALHRKADGNPRGEADALRSLCLAFLDLDRAGDSVDACRQALELARQAADRRLQVQALHALARAEARRADLAEARLAIEEALVLVESQSSRAGDPRIRTTLLASNQDLYELAIDILLRLDTAQPGKGWATAALETVERSRARGLLDLLGEARTEIRQGVDPALLRREAELQRRLNARERHRARLASARPPAPELAAVSAEVDGLVAEYEEAQRQIRAASPRYAALTQPQPAHLGEIQKGLLDDGTVLLEYALGEERSHVWRVTSSQIEVFPLPGREAIETAARHLHELLGARGERRRFETAEQRTQRIAAAEAAIPAAASALGDTVLGPLTGRLGSSRLLVVAHGALQLVPFAILPEPGRPGEPLLDHHEIVNAPSASVLLSLRRELAGRAPAPRSVAVLADPVFSADDPRLPRTARTEPAANPAGPAADLRRSAEESGLIREGAEIPRLIFTREEAASLLAASARRDDLAAFDFAASRETARSPEMKRYRIVHLATHALLNDRHPDLSGIVLSLVDAQGNPRDGFLRLHDIYNLQLGADLVVLSACRTALGAEIRGEGLLGLTRGFFYAGAPRVLASLWNAHDEATAELMKRFYQGLLREGLTPAAALRKAQLGMARETRWRSPYYWAPMVLQGEWR